MPYQLLQGQQVTQQGTFEFYWITALFDSGASMPGYVDNLCNYRNPGVFIGAQIAPLFGINYFNFGQRIDNDVTLFDEMRQLFLGQRPMVIERRDDRGDSYHDLPPDQASVFPLPIG